MVALRAKRRKVASAVRYMDFTDQTRFRLRKNTAFTAFTAGKSNNGDELGDQEVC